MENPSRRRVLAAGITGTAVTVAGRRAVASAPPTSPPARPTEADEELLAFAQRLELTASDLYQVALDEGAAGDRDRVLQTCRDNHQAAADALSGLLGTSAPGRRVAAPFADWATAFYEETVGGFTTSDLPAVAEAGYALESAAVATHTGMLGQLEGTDGARTIAAILMIESRMCTVLADVQGLGDDDGALFDNGAVALTPTATEG